MYQFEDKRIEDLSGWAEANGFTFDIADPDDEILGLPLHFLSAIYRSNWNVIRGDWNGVPFEAFDLMRGKTRLGRLQSAHAGIRARCTSMPSATGCR